MREKRCRIKAINGVEHGFGLTCFPWQRLVPQLGALSLHDFNHCQLTGLPGDLPRDLVASHPRYGLSLGDLEGIRGVEACK